MISHPNDAPVKRIRASPRSSVAITMLVALAIGALLYFAHALFIPIALPVGRSAHEPPQCLRPR
jgi:hypothetical protein